MKKIALALCAALCLATLSAAALAVPGEIPEEARVSAWAISDYLIRNFEPLYASEVDITPELSAREDIDENRTEIDFLVDYNAVSLVGLDPEGEYTGALFVYNEADYPAGLLRVLLMQYAKLSTEYAREGEALVVVISMSGMEVPIADEETAAAFLQGLENTDPAQTP